MHIRSYLSSFSSHLTSSLSLSFEHTLVFCLLSIERFSFPTIKDKKKTHLSYHLVANDNTSDVEETCADLIEK